MWNPLSLRSRILAALSALVFVTCVGGLVSMWHGHRMEIFVEEVLDSELPALDAARELKAALVMQKGYVTYYFQDGDPQWLSQLAKYDREFEKWFSKARQKITSDREREILNKIDREYVRYEYQRNQVIALYKEGKRDEGFRLQQAVRPRFFQIIELCRELTDAHRQEIGRVRRKIRTEATTVHRLTIGALAIVVALGMVLAFILLRHVLDPIRELAESSEGPEMAGRMGDEVKALRVRFQKLVGDIDQTQSKLEWSREHLQLAEKWAVVGKLAAGVAHSVRNPLTSVKMRLFSLARNLDLDPDQKEDFDVISDSIGHIDNVVTNFLEFARPPKIKIRMSSPSDAVDTAVQLLSHRLDTYKVYVQVKRHGRLPEIPVDLDQLKEVLVNLMVNSCEAMPDGGTIVIEEETGPSEGMGEVVLIKVSDDGPGVPEAIQGKLFQPFFSTKKEGTGLGLSIATRIVEEHGGWLDLKSKAGEGTTFIISLPAGEKQTWAQS
jgi:signal transduction histidine kinase